MKQKIVVKVSMPCERSRSRAMALAARADGAELEKNSGVRYFITYLSYLIRHGVISMAITGDARDKLEVVGDGVDAVRLVSCLRRKLGSAEILQVEEVKDKKPEEKKKPKPKPLPLPPVVVHPPPQGYPGGYYYYHHHPPPPMVICEEPNTCPIM